MKKIVIIILIIIATGIFFALQSEWFNKENQAQEITKDVALELVRDHLIEGECRSEGVDELYRSCDIEMEKLGENIWLIMVIYEGFFDDSVRGSRLRANAILEKDNWALQGDLLEDFRCWLGRGHEDFSTELCI
jgi:hypothetical protein